MACEPSVMSATLLIVNDLRAVKKFHVEDHPPAGHKTSTTQGGVAVLEGSCSSREVSACLELLEAGS